MDAWLTALWVIALLTAASVVVLATLLGTSGFVRSGNKGDITVSDCGRKMTINKKRKAKAQKADPQTATTAPAETAPAGFRVDQRHHGFAVGQPVWWTGSCWALATTDAAVDTLAVVVDVQGRDAVVLTTSGTVDVPGVRAGVSYYLGPKAGVLETSGATLVLVGVSDTSALVCIRDAGTTDVPRDLEVHVGGAGAADTNDGITAPVATLARAFEVVQQTGYDESCTICVDADTTLEPLLDCLTGALGTQCNPATLRGARDVVAVDALPSALVRDTEHGMLMVTLDAPIAGARVGDFVEFTSGCLRDLTAPIASTEGDIVLCLAVDVTERVGANVRFIADDLGTFNVYRNTTAITIASSLLRAHNAAALVIRDLIVVHDTPGSLEMLCSTGVSVTFRGVTLRCNAPLKMCAIEGTMRLDGSHVDATVGPVWDGGDLVVTGCVFTGAAAQVRGAVRLVENCWFEDCAGLYLDGGVPVVRNVMVHTADVVFAGTRAVAESLSVRNATVSVDRGELQAAGLWVHDCLAPLTVSGGARVHIEGDFEPTAPGGALTVSERSEVCVTGAIRATNPTLTTFASVSDHSTLRCCRIAATLTAPLQTLVDVADGSTLDVDADVTVEGPAAVAIAATDASVRVGAVSCTSAALSLAQAAVAQVGVVLGSVTLADGCALKCTALTAANDVSVGRCASLTALQTVALTNGGVHVDGGTLRVQQALTVSSDAHDGNALHASDATVHVGSLSVTGFAGTTLDQSRFTCDEAAVLGSPLIASRTVMAAFSLDAPSALIFQSHLTLDTLSVSASAAGVDGLVLDGSHLMCRAVNVPSNWFTDAALLVRNGSVATVSDGATIGTARAGEGAPVVVDASELTLHGGAVDLRGAASRVRNGATVRVAVTTAAFDAVVSAGSRLVTQGSLTGTVQLTGASVMTFDTPTDACSVRVGAQPAAATLTALASGAPATTTDYSLTPSQLCACQFTGA